MSDSDDDNIVRYGTQLEPYEEDCTSMMSQNKPQQRKILRPWAAINYQAQELPVPPVKKSKKRKKKRPLKATQQFPPPQENFSRDCVTAQEHVHIATQQILQTRETPSYWDIQENNRKRCFPNENDDKYSNKSMKYSTIAGPSRRRSISEVEPDWEPPYKITKTSRIEPNYWERQHSPPSKLRAGSPMDCSSNNLFVQDPELKYIDADDCLQVKVHNGTRAVRHNDNNDDGTYFDQFYKVQKTLHDDSSNYDWEPDRPSRIGLRNASHPTNQDVHDSHDRNFWSTCQSQESSQNGTIKLEYVEDLDRPSREGLRNETHPMRQIPVYDSGEEGTTMYNVRHVIDSSPGADYKDFLNVRDIMPVRDHQWHQPLEPQETDDSELFGPGPIRVGIHNVAAPISKKHAVLVHQAINNEIVRIGVQGAGPKFLRSNYDNGSIYMTCENHESRKWLEREVPKLRPWPEARLSVKLGSQMPRTIVLTLLIRTNHGVSDTTALELLRIQNPGLDTRKWNLMKIKKVNEGKILYVCVDEASFQALRLVSFRVNLGMQKVSFWVKSAPKVSNKKLVTKKKVKSNKNKPNPSDVIKRSLSTKSLDRYFVPSSSPLYQNGENGSTKESLKHSMTYGIQNSQAVQTDLRQSLIRKREAKSPPSKKWYQPVDQDYSFSDWVPW
uniref:DUF4780 domain-containing protein n=1 Tax=Heliothis virescens TaxID=7102 RepID=A0A2A4J753_HELVI